MNAAFEKRRRWFDQHFAALATTLNEAIAYTCPCCSYPTLDERGHYDICPLCNWEDDGQEDSDADRVLGGPNGRYSLSEARQNFQRFLIMYDLENDERYKPQDKDIPRDSAIEIAAKQAMMAAFDAMVGKQDLDVVQQLLAKVKEQQQVLEQEIERRIQAYEAKIVKRPSDELLES